MNETPNYSFSASRLRCEINDSKASKSSQKPETPINQDKAPTGPAFPTKLNEIQNALTILKAPKPRPQHQFTNGTIELSSGAKAFDLTVKQDENADKKLSARIFSSYYKILKTFKPLNSMEEKSRGIGTSLHSLIEDYNYFIKEEIEHCNEVLDYLRQTLNAEKAYSIVFNTVTQEEVIAKKEFQTSISTLKLILTVKRMDDQKILRLVEYGLISKQSYDDIYYYLNFETFKKWEERGFAV